MEQVHRRFTAEHVRNLLRGYAEGLLDRGGGRLTEKRAKGRGEKPVYFHFLIVIYF
jgi:hypothetical protein